MIFPLSDKVAFRFILLMLYLLFADLTADRMAHSAEKKTAH